MENIYVIRQKLQEAYATRAIVFDKAIQFVVALTTFLLINNNIGFMKMAAQPFITLALAVICTFFPFTMTIVVAAVLILVHTFAASMGIAAVTVIVFLTMFALYLRLTPKMALVVLLTPIAFALKIPCIIPIAYALVYGPACIIAIGCGTIVFFMMEYVKKIVPSLKSGESIGLMEQVTGYVKQVFQNKELWVTLAAFIICFLLVYTIRRQAMDHAWKVAILSGAIGNVLVVTVGDIAFGVSISFGSLIIGSVIAIGIGMILEICFFSVDYSRSEKLQYEDDEYVYYVKAVPKVGVTTPEKTIKRINEREETEIIDAAEVRRRAVRAKRESESAGRRPESGRTRDPKKPVNRRPVQKDDPRRTAKRPATKRGPSTKRQDIAEVDKMLLTQSLRKELNLDD